MPANILFLEKPVKVADLTAIIDEVIALFEEHRDEYKCEEEDVPEVKKNIFRRIFEYFY